MAASVLQLVAKFPSVSGMPEDSTENVFNVGLDSASVTAGEAEDLAIIARDFYDEVAPTSTFAVGEYLSDSLSRGAFVAQILAYHTDDLTGVTDLGSPVFTLPFQLIDAQDPVMLPEEVAAVISTRGDLTNVPVEETNPSPPPATIRPQQRRRGRTYIGPLISNAGASIDGFYRPSTAFRFDLINAMRTFVQDVEASGLGDLGVWSKADAEVWPMVAGYVDNAWDTQRRRGVAATTRTSLTF